MKKSAMIGILCVAAVLLAAGPGFPAQETNDNTANPLQACYSTCQVQYDACVDRCQYLSYITAADRLTAADRVASPAILCSDNCRTERTQCVEVCDVIAR